MSNYTDGKKALAAGDFALAERKLIKALDKRPDDGELWWALTLCKTECRTDAELKAKLTAETERAADAGESAPKNPFDTTQAKNAFAFDRTGKRRSFAEELYAELSDIWLKKRGKPLKSFRATAEYKPVSRSALLTAAAYIAVVLSAVGAGLILYAMSGLARWALWTGFALFVVAVVAVFAIRFVRGRKGKKIGTYFTLELAVFAAFAIGLLILGLNRGIQYAVIFGAVILVALMMYVMFKAFKKKNDREKGGRVRAEKTAKAKKPRLDDGYTDDFD